MWNIIQVGARYQPFTFEIPAHLICNEREKKKSDQGQDEESARNTTSDDYDDNGCKRGNGEINRGFEYEDGYKREGGEGDSIDISMRDTVAKCSKIQAGQKMKANRKKKQKHHEKTFSCLRYDPRRPYLRMQVSTVLHDMIAQYYGDGVFEKNESSINSHLPALCRPGSNDHHNGTCSSTTSFLLPPLPSSISDRNDDIRVNVGEHKTENVKENAPKLRDRKKKQKEEEEKTKKNEQKEEREQIDKKEEEGGDEGRIGAYHHAAAICNYVDHLLQSFEIYMNHREESRALVHATGCEGDGEEEEEEVDDDDNDGEEGEEEEEEKKKKREEDDEDARKRKTTRRQGKEERGKGKRIGGTSGRADCNALESLTTSFIALRCDIMVMMMMMMMKPYHHDNNYIVEKTNNNNKNGDEMEYKIEDGKNIKERNDKGWLKEEEEKVEERRMSERKNGKKDEKTKLKILLQWRARELKMMKEKENIRINNRYERGGEEKSWRDAPRLVTASLEAFTRLEREREKRERVGKKIEHLAVRMRCVRRFLKTDTSMGNSDSHGREKGAVQKKREEEGEEGRGRGRRERREAGRDIWDEVQRHIDERWEEAREAKLRRRR